MARRPHTALQRHQSLRLVELRDLGLCTDESLASAVSATGESIDRSTVTKYRNGTRCASLGLLDLILNHVDDPAAVLNIWAKDHDLRVVPDTDLEADERGLTDRALELSGVVGHLALEVKEVLADGVVSAKERESLLFTVRRLAQELAELRAMLETRAA